MLPLATSTWDDEEYQALQEVIEKGNFSMGERVSEFEEKFSQYTGSKYSVMVNSGSSANLLAIAALFYRKENSLKAGDEIIVPAVSWSTTYYPLHQYGLKLKFVDIDRETLNLDLNKLEDAITDKTRAIFAVNLLGNPVDFEVINDLIRDKNIILLEDNCESLGAIFKGKKAGTFGLLGTFSTYFSHHISTMEGGVVSTNDEELYHVMLSLRSHGWTRHLPQQNLVCKKNDNSFHESFRFVLPGYNLRPLEMSGALGIKQLKKLPEIITGRRKNAEVFQELFGDLTEYGVNIQKEIGCSSWFGFSIVIDGGRRDKLVMTLSENGIDCRPIVAGNFLRNPVIKYFDYEVHSDLSNADFIHDNGLFIGNHHYDIASELDSIYHLFKSGK